MNRRVAIASTTKYRIALVAWLFALAGCEPDMTGFVTNGPNDTSIAASRLIGGKLSHITEPFGWYFDESTFLLESDQQPLPQELVRSLFDGEQNIMSVRGRWNLADDGRTIILREIVSNEIRGRTRVELPIQAAGFVRIDLGEHQYNVISASQMNGK